MIYVPVGFATAFATLANLEEVRGGSPWGAGTFAVSIRANTFWQPHRYTLTDVPSQGADGSRMPSEQELSLAKTHGEVFYKTVAKVNFA